MGQVLIPESIAPLVLSQPGEVSIGPSFPIIGGQQFDVSTVLCQTAVSGFGGIDNGSYSVGGQRYYVYFVKQGGNVGLVASLSASGPAGFTVWRKLDSGFYSAASGTDIMIVFQDDREQVYIESYRDDLSYKPNPSLGFFYNGNNHLLLIPAGDWIVGYEATAQMNRYDSPADVTFMRSIMTLGTVNGGPGGSNDPGCSADGFARTLLHRSSSNTNPCSSDSAGTCTSQRKQILAVPTNYYLNMAMTHLTGGQGTFNIYASDTARTIWAKRLSA